MYDDLAFLSHWFFILQGPSSWTLFFLKESHQFIHQRSLYLCPHTFNPNLEINLQSFHTLPALRKLKSLISDYNFIHWVFSFLIVKLGSLFNILVAPLIAFLIYILILLVFIGLWFSFKSISQSFVFN